MPNPPLTVSPATIDAICAAVRELAALDTVSEDAAGEFLRLLQTRFGPVPYALALNVLVAEAANPQGGPAAWLAFHALKLLLRRIAAHFEDVADGLGLTRAASPLAELARQARNGDRAAADVLAFITVHTMAPGGAALGDTTDRPSS